MLRLLNEEKLAYERASFVGLADIFCQNTLHLIDIQLFIECLGNWFCAAGNPDVQFRFQIKCAGCFHGEASNIFVRDGLIFRLFAPNTLLVY